MTQSPRPENDPNLADPTPRSPRMRRLRRVAVPLGIGLVAGLGGAAWWGWRFVNDELSPLVETTLTELLNRPVQVGDVQGVGLGGLTLGPSSVPATPTDSDRATVEQVQVGFNLWEAVVNRKLALDITLVNPVVYLEQTPVGWVETTLKQQDDQDGLVELKTLRVKNGTATLYGLGTVNGKRSPVELENLNGKLNLFDKNKRLVYDLQARSRTNGNVSILGETQLPAQETNLQIQAENFLLPEVDRLLNLPFDLRQGRGGGNLRVELRPNLKTPPLFGTAQFTNTVMAIPGVPQPFTKAQGTLQFQNNRIRLDEVVGSYGKATAQVKGAIDLDKGFNLAANVKSITLPDVLETLALEAPVPVAGTVQLALKVTGPIQKPVLLGVAQSLRPGAIDKVALNRYRAAFKLDTAASDIVLQGIQAQPASGGQVTGSGRIDLAKKDADGKVRPEVALGFVALNVPADAIAAAYNQGNPPGVAIGLVNAQAQISGPADRITTLIRWQAPQAQYPGAGEIQIANGLVNLRNTTLAVEGGTVAAEATANLGTGRWQGLATIARVPLNRFSQELRGIFNGKFTASGSLAALSPAGIRAEGTAFLSQGVSLIDRPLTAQVRWNGQQLLIDEATAPGFSADGAIAVNLEGTPGIRGFDLNVNLADYNLQSFPVAVPSSVQYSGLADFRGKITGTPTAPNVNGNLALKRFILNGVAFDPVLQGPVQYGRGAQLDLRGQQDRIAVALDSQLQPLGFEIRRGDAIATGRTQGDILQTEIRNFPLALARIPGLTAQFAPTGTLSGDVAINLNQLTAAGNIVIDRPGLGAYRGDRFTGRISYADGVATLSNGMLQRGDTILQFTAGANLLTADPQFKSKITIAQGKLQDVLEALQVFELGDFAKILEPPAYGSAADLATAPVNTANVPILDQLRRLSEIEKLQALDQTAESAQPLPDLADLTGTFTGDIDVSGSLRSGINAAFNIRGADFQWGRFAAKDVVAIGSFKNGELSLLPLRLQNGDELVAFSGQLLGPNQSGQLRIENFPLATLTQTIDLPIAIDGLLNATATISGSFNNPRAIGNYRLANGELNGTAVQAARGNFTYSNARLDFSNTLAIAENQPLSIVGSVPYQLPFGVVPPDNDQIKLDINVRDEGLALLNVFTNQVAWLEGKGAVSLQVRGTLNAPIATGFVEVNDAKLQARALPEPLTNVSGLARFDQDRIRVERFTGKFSQGEVVAMGVLPLNTRLRRTDPDRENPLNVKLDKIGLNLKGLYDGAVDGLVTVGGTALAPVLGGEIVLSRGRVLLNEAAGAANGGEGGGATTPPTDQAEGTPVEFDDLKLTLGDRIVLTSDPLIRFVASGDLVINGTLDQPLPAGTISLRSGQVNLFTTQFSLERGYPQTAIFEPERGLDPVLDVRLIALVPEVTSRRQPTVLSPSEILDVPAPASSLGSVRTVRVRAQVEGPASRLAENLALTSSPPRSEEEIVALIGGGFVDTLGRGDTLLGLANIAGSAFLTNIQGAIGNALGLSEFRLFPTTTSSEASRDSAGDGDGGSTLGLAAEAAVDITPAISVSVLKILTNNQPAQFGLRYRINDYLLIRSSTDLSGDTRAAIEYEARF